MSDDFKEVIMFGTVACLIAFGMQACHESELKETEKTITMAKLGYCQASVRTNMDGSQLIWQPCTGVKP
jgi:hypothetical protein